MVTHRGIDYITIDEFLSDNAIIDELRNTFIGYLKRDSRFDFAYEDVDNVFYYDYKKLYKRYVKFNSIYLPKNHCSLLRFMLYKKINDIYKYKFTGYVSGSKIDKVVLPKYKTNGVKIKSDKWIIYNKIDLQNAFDMWVE